MRTRGREGAPRQRRGALGAVGQPVRTYPAPGGDIAALPALRSLAAVLPPPHRSGPARAPRRGRPPAPQWPWRPSLRRPRRSPRRWWGGQPRPRSAHSPDGARQGEPRPARFEPPLASLTPFASGAVRNEPGGGRGAPGGIRAAGDVR